MLWMLLFAVMPPAANSPAASPAPGNAKAVVDAIYRALPTNRFDFHDVRYAPRLRRLLQRESAAAHGEVGLIDSVPFCDCQDTAANYAFTSYSRTTGRDTAEVTVRLTNGPISTYRIDVERLPTGWAVADIHAPHGINLVGMLSRNLPAEHPARNRDK